MRWILAVTAACFSGCTGTAGPPPEEAGTASAGGGAGQTGAGPRFTDVTEEAGVRFRHRAGGGVKDYIVEAKGGGGALFDADGDGWLDLYLVNGGRLEEDDPTPRDALYLNRRDGTFAEAGLSDDVGEGWGMGALAGDVDNDGDADLVVTHLEGARLYRNLGTEEVVYAAADEALTLDRWCTGAAFADYDLDGDLDLYVARYVDFDLVGVPPRAGMWKGLMVFAGPMGLPANADALLRNDGGAFVEVSEASGVAEAAPTYGLGVVFTDYDGDGDADLFVANDSAANYLFRNDGGAGEGRRFREVAWEARVAFSAEGTAQAGMGVASDDYDGDGDRDLFVTHFEDDYNTLYRNDGGGRFTVTSHEAGLALVGLPWLAFGTCFLDADNDGDLDLVVAQGHVYPQIRHLDAPGYAQPDHLLMNLGAAAGHRFELAPAGDLGQPGVTRGLMKGDWDEDGDVDLAAMRLDGRPALLRNDGPSRGHWLVVDLEGTGANRDAVGALVTVVAGDLSRTVEIAAGGSYLSHSDTRAHFGLGSRAAVDAVEVRWPGGGLQALGPMPADRLVRIRQP